VGGRAPLRAQDRQGQFGKQVRVPAARGRRALLRQVPARPEEGRRGGGPLRAAVDRAVQQALRRV